MAKVSASGTFNPCSGQAAAAFPSEELGTEFAHVAGKEDDMLNQLRDWTFPLALTAVWTIAAAYTLALAGLPW